MNELVLWGGTGQAKVIAEFASQLGFRVVAVVDNDPSKSTPLPGVPILQGEAGLRRWLDSGVRRDSLRVAVAIGGSKGRDRTRIQTALEAMGLRPATLVHPFSYVAKNAQLGKGTQILANATVGAEAVLGEACIVNTGASVDHECRLEDGVHIGPGATLAGTVHVGAFAFVGAGATVLPRIRIGRDVVVGAGSVVTRDLPDAVIAYGVPARALTFENVDEEVETLAAD